MPTKLTSTRSPALRGRNLRFIRSSFGNEAGCAPVALRTPNGLVKFPTNSGSTELVPLQSQSLAVRLHGEQPAIRGSYSNKNGERSETSQKALAAPKKDSYDAFVEYIECYGEGALREAHDAEIMKPQYFAMGVLLCWGPAILSPMAATVGALVASTLLPVSFHLPAFFIIFTAAAIAAVIPTQLVVFSQLSPSVRKPFYYLLRHHPDETIGEAQALRTKAISKDKLRIFDDLTNPSLYYRKMASFHLASGDFRKILRDEAINLGGKNSEQMDQRAKTRVRLSKQGQALIERLGHFRSASPENEDLIAALRILVLTFGRFLPDLPKIIEAIRIEAAQSDTNPASMNQLLTLARDAESLIAAYGALESGHLALADLPDGRVSLTENGQGRLGEG